LYVTQRGKRTSPKSRGVKWFAVYQISTYCAARWLVADFKTFEEALKFLKRYRYDAEVVDSWGRVLAVKFDGRITITEEDGIYVQPYL